MDDTKDLAKEALRDGLARELDTVVDLLTDKRHKLTESEIKHFEEYKQVLSHRLVEMMLED